MFYKAQYRDGYVATLYEHCLRSYIVHMQFIGYHIYCRVHAHIMQFIQIKEFAFISKIEIQTLYMRPFTHGIDSLHNYSKFHGIRDSYRESPWGNPFTYST